MAVWVVTRPGNGPRPSVGAPPGGVVVAGKAAIGGPIRLFAADGAVVTEADLKLRPTLVLFGSVQREGLAAAALPQIEKAFNERGLAPTSDWTSPSPTPRVLFIALDAAAHAAMPLAKLLGVYSKTFVAVSGDADELKRAANTFKIYFKVSQANNGPIQVDHTPVMFLMDSSWNYISMTRLPARPNNIAELLEVTREP